MARGFTRALLVPVMIVAGTVIGFVGLGAPAGASVLAYGPTPCTVTITISPATVAPGEVITITFSGACTNDTFTIVLHSSAMTLGTITTNSTGAASGTFTIPSSTSAGTHTITATDPAGNTASATLTVTGVATAAAAPPATTTSGLLPVTGTDVAALTALGALAVGGGGMLVLASRRRRRNTFS